MLNSVIRFVSHNSNLTRFMGWMSWNPTSGMEDRSYSGTSSLSVKPEIEGCQSSRRSSLLSMMYKGRALFLVVALFQLLLASLLSSGCAPTTSERQTYLYQGPEGFLDSVGNQERIPVPWTAQPGPMTSTAKPDTILLKAELIGPFKSINEVLHWIQHNTATNDMAGKAIVATAPVQQVDSWTKQVLTSYIPVSPQLKRGYYNLRYSVVVQASTGETTNHRDGPLKVHCLEDVPSPCV